LGTAAQIFNEMQEVLEDVSLRVETINTDMTKGKEEHKREIETLSKAVKTL